ncbi:MAG: hypothetical protein WCT22_00390 [Patescibacteria group bacterium]
MNRRITPAEVVFRVISSVSLIGVGVLGWQMRQNHIDVMTALNARPVAAQGGGGGQPSPGEQQRLGADIIPATLTLPVEQNAESSNLIKIFESQNIKVELPNPNWPTSYQEVANILKNDEGTPILTADKVTAIIETEPDGSKVWRGWYMAEPPFPLKEGITYSPEGYHVDTEGRPVFDPELIFETDWDKVPNEIKDNFSDRLVDLKINEPGIAVFARRGGATRDGLPQNTHYFAGTEGVTIPAIEQLSLIPVPENLCPEDIGKAALTRAYRQAAMEFRDNNDAKNGAVDVQWFNPEIENFVRMDGRMIARLALQGVELSVLERLTPGYPVSPEEVSINTGGKADKWVFEPKTGEWFYEAFDYQHGITYKEGVGPVDRQGNLLFGAIQTDSRTSQVFDFSFLDVASLAQFMYAPPLSMQADLFARVGGYPSDLSIQNRSFYTWDGGKENGSDIVLPEPGIEQARLEIVGVDSCPVDTLPSMLRDRVQTLAEDQPGPNVEAWYWNGYTFVKVIR